MRRLSAVWRTAEPVLVCRPKVDTMFAQAKRASCNHSYMMGTSFVHLPLDWLFNHLHQAIRAFFTTKTVLHFSSFRFFQLASLLHIAFIFGMADPPHEEYININISIRFTSGFVLLDRFLKQLGQQFFIVTKILRRKVDSQLFVLHICLKSVFFQSL
jgi:hypothetical protein